MALSPIPTRAELARLFGERRVLVVGDVIADEYLTGECARLSPEAPVPVLEVRERRFVLGGAANAAANVAALGGRAVLVGAIGNDSAGREVEETATAAGIRLIAVRDGRPTTRKTRVVGQQQQLVRIDQERSSPLAPEVQADLLDVVLREIANVQAVIVSDYAKGVVTKRVCQGIVELGRSIGVPVIIDPRPQHGPFYQGCDYLTPNWKELRGLLGRLDVPPSESDLLENARALSALVDTNVLLTLGAHGICFYGRDGEFFTAPTVAKEVFDVSGAGDTVAATFALGRACDLSHHAAVTLANRAAGVVVGKQGTATLTLDELFVEDSESRLVTRAALAPLARALRGAGKRIVTVNGTFDVLHAGHLHILEEARRQGDVLIVGLNSDASVRALKGPSRPVNPAQLRTAMLLGLRSVDYVHVFDELVPMPFLDEVRPDVHVNGAEYGENCVEAATVRAHGGRLHLVDRLPGLSTSRLLQTLDTVGPGAA